LARTNLTQGVSQTAIGSAQEGFLQARQLRERLELLEMQWEHHRQLASESAVAALLTLDEHRLIEYRLANDHPLEVDVDYWTEGRWQQLRERVAQLRRQSEDVSSTLSLTEFQSLQSDAEAAREEALALVVVAKTAALSSINRRDIQESILERLGEMGFEHLDSSYEGEDFRRAFHLKLRNANGDELVTIVEPAGDDFANRLIIDFFDQSPNEQVREERMDLIREQIEAETEIAVAPMQCEPAYASGNAPEERRDFSRVRAANLKKTTKTG